MWLTAIFFVDEGGIDRETLVGQATKKKKKECKRYFRLFEIVEKCVECDVSVVVMFKLQGLYGGWEVQGEDAGLLGKF